MMFFGFLLKFLGGGVIQSLINARQVAMQSANETLRIKLQGEIALLNAELDMRKANVDLQKSNNQYLLLRLGMGMLTLGVGAYWASRFWARLLGLDDFHVFIKPLDADEVTVSMMVLIFWFGGRIVGR